jgi:tetratricopeptide (TPR) repeat protein
MQKRKNNYSRRALSKFKTDNYSYEDTVHDMDMAIESDLNNASLYRQRAQLKQWYDKFGDAIADYTKTLEITPDDTNAYLNRGLMYRKMQRYDEAILDYTQLIELSPTNSTAFRNRGIAKLLSEKYNYENITEDLDTAIKLSPTDTSLLSRANSIAWVRFKMASSNLPCISFTLASSS